MARYTMQDGERLYVREIGQGQPVLVLSGLGMQSWQWLPYLLPNLKKFKFIIPDWRGFGGSSQCKISNADAISSHWNDIDCLIEQLNLDQFILIGYSMGATTSMHGIQYGDLAQKIKAYLHIDQTPKIETDESWAFGLMGNKHSQFKQLLHQLSNFLESNVHYELLKNLPNEKRNELVELWLDFMKLQSDNKVSNQIFKWALKQNLLQEHLMPMQRLDYMRWYINNYLTHAEDYRDAIAQLACPTTFFIGKQSTLYPSKGQIEIANSLQDADYVLFQKSGHAPLMSEPFKFTKEISKFLMNNQ